MSRPVSHGVVATTDVPTRPVAPGPGPSDRWLAEMLADAGMITAAQADALAAEAQVWAAAVARGLASHQQILETISIRFKVPIADLSGVNGRVAALLPEAIARKYLIVPIGADDRTIRVAAADPRDLALEQTLAFVTGRDVIFLVAPPDDLAAKVDEVYRPEAAVNRLVGGLNPGSIETIDEAPLIAPPEDPTLDAPMARLVDAMISGAVRERAGEIHCEPLAEGTSVRYRIDGVLREVMRLPPSAGPALVRRVKILARLDVTDPLRPHGGRSAVRVDGKAVDLRIATVPVARRGEKVVIRILDKENLRASLPALDLPDGEERLLQRLLGHREGIVLVTGPTGSGKTTTLYAALNQLRNGRINIVTVEDPVEYDVPGVSQLQVNEAQGFTFASALRSVLRQDPDVVLVGEIRDGETATIAAQASLSGHLVLSTLDTNDTASAVVRLRDLGVDSPKIAAALKGVVAQRLVRRLCEQCAAPVTIDALPPEARPGSGRAATPKRAVGCKACGGTGYRGRMAILEVMAVDEQVARQIGAGAVPEALVAATRSPEMVSLWESGLDRVWRGATSLDEVVRVLGERVGEEGPTGAGPGQAPATGAAAKPSSGASRAAATADDEAPARVLVADDDRQMRRLVRMVLERAGHTVVEAADGLDALAAIEADQLDLMILDLEMPRLDGIGVLEELRARVMTSSLPVIVLTARTGSEAEVLDLGAQDFLTKPVQPGSLQVRVRAVLRRSRIR